MDRCPHCGSRDLKKTPTPTLQHHAKLECSGCGRFLKWLPKPSRSAAVTLDEALPVVHPRRRPAPLEGTERQCRFARSLRARALYSFGKLGRDDLVGLVKCITDATWFIANQGRKLADIRWPDASQMEWAVSSGSCPNCGELVYSTQLCSDECADEFAAYLMSEAR